MIFADISGVEKVELKESSNKFIHSLFIGELERIDEEETINDDLPLSLQNMRLLV